MRSLSLLFTLLFSFVSFGQGYDEVFDANGIRPHYQPYYKYYNRLSPAKKEKLIQASKKAFTGDNTLLPLPRVFTDEESDTLRRGVDQRARALQAFLKDHYSGRKSYLAANVIPESVLNSAIKRNGEVPARKIKTENTFNFWYGPDVIRDKEGTFRVVEDNLGFIGGMGDLSVARKSLVESVPGYAASVEKTVRPDGFYDAIATRYIEMAKAKKGIPVLITYPWYQRADTEDRRLIEIFKKRGIENFTAGTYNSNKKKFLKIKPDGVYLQTRRTNGRIKSKKIGHAILDYEVVDLDNLDPNNYKKYLTKLVSDYTYKGLTKDQQRELAALKDDLQDHKKIERWFKKNLPSQFEEGGFEGFWKSVREGKLSVTNNWGHEFINDKGIYPYVDGFIRYYLNEEPIIKNIETHPAALFKPDGTFTLNQEIFNRAQKNPEDWVFKGVTGRGGDQVFIGKKLAPEKFTAALQELKAHPDYYIFQKYTPLSELDDYIVDVRVLSDVSDAGVITAEVPWGRALPINGNGKVNISDEGRETAIVIARPLDCSTPGSVLRQVIATH